jgi:hypothetical protein
MTSNINNGKGMTISRNDMNFPIVTHKLKLDYKEGQAYLVIEYDWADGFYYVSAFVELNGQELRASDVDEGDFMEDLNEFFGDYMHIYELGNWTSLEVPDDILEMIEQALDYLAARELKC